MFFQAESPSSNDLSALSIYLLTCLLFVGCAILEFAYLLHRRRCAERRNECKKSKTFPKRSSKSTCNKHNAIEAKEYNIFESRQHQIMEMNSKKIEKQHFWNKSHILDLKCCTLNIDIFSQWLFLFMFTLFNIIYWFYYLKILPMLTLLL